MNPSRVLNMTWREAKAGWRGRFGEGKRRPRMNYSWPSGMEYRWSEKVESCTGSGHRSSGIMVRRPVLELSISQPCDKASGSIRPLVS